jgi:hypothetical protein
MRVEVVFEPEATSHLLEIPWESAEPASGYFDLRESPHSIDRLEPARQSRPLRSFLAAVNSADSVFATARAKTWLGRNEPASSPDSCEFSSRVDLVFASEQFNVDRARYDELCRRLQELLTRDAAPDTLRAELRVCPCRFLALGRAGFCLRMILSARGSAPEQAELRWGLGLARLQQALLFCSRILRQQMGQAS